MPNLYLQRAFTALLTLCLLTTTVAGKTKKVQNALFAKTVVKNDAKIYRGDSSVVTVYAYIDEDGDESTTGDQTSIGTTSVEVHVDKGIWDKATSYIAIIAIAIIIVVAVLYYIRSNPKAKPTTTFTQLEEEKKAGKDSKAPAEKKASTERRRYDASSESKEAAPAEEPKEKEASSFSELADEKKAKKSSGKDGEGKKLKYVSSRRK